jgi:hypothetical protein
MGRRKKNAWNKSVTLLGVVDAFFLDEFQKIGPKRFTWSKKNPLTTWSRLDHFYVNFSN